MGQFETLYNRVLIDHDFRALLNTNPTQALQSVGITATPQLLTALAEIAKGVQDLQNTLPADSPAVGLSPHAISNKSCVV